MASSNESLSLFISKILSKVKDWLLLGAVDRLILVVTDVDSGEVLERWQFSIELEKDASISLGNSKSEKQIQAEIQAIIRQITASVTFLPIFDQKCKVFNVICRFF